MGKRKVPKTQTTTSNEQGKSRTDDTVKGKKTYCLPTAEKVSNENDDVANLPKVQIPNNLENVLIELILEEQKCRKNLGDISKRITAKKLTNVYNSLTDAGFSKNQVEAAMSATIACGGDLLDALDWLCLNTQNDQLPAGFSETLHKEEEKLRPQFDKTLQVDMKVGQTAAAAPAITTLKGGTVKSTEQKGSVKDWVLKYAEQSSDEEDEEEEAEETHFDPTARYTALHNDLQDLKDQAAIAKGNNNTEQHKQLSKLLREIHLEMSGLEKHPDFDKSIKSQLKGGQSSKSETKKNKQQTTDAQAAQDDTLGFSLFTQGEATAIVSPAEEAPGTREDVRTFEYTRSQWTGKSPKQFLIDWVRKHLPKSGPPKFTKVQVKLNRFKNIATVDRHKDGVLSVTPDILCDNIKDSEHLASTLALYQLCKGQPVHQLLPPPYRAVWLEWADAEKKEKDEAVEKENKPRDQFIVKLMKKLNLEDVPAKASQASTTDTDITGDIQEDDWETLADRDQLNEICPSGTREPLQNVDKSKKSTDPRLLQKALSKRHSTAEYQELLTCRQQLPVFQYRDQVLSAIRDNSVIIIAGETGSGKSTQIPQFVLEDCIERGVSNVYAVCTQPRRISATSLATRVSSEMGEGALSQKEALVGYQIRFESHKGPSTRLLYSTTGVVLRQLQADRDLRGITHLIIDEVHERSVQSDYLMIVVKEILTRRSDLKVILMSATMDSGKFSAYFQHCPVITIPGKTYEVEVCYLEDVIEKTGYVIDEDSPYTLNPKYLVQETEASVDITQKGGDTSKQVLTWTKEDISKIDRTNLSAENYSLRTRNAISRLNLNRINLDLILDLLNHIETSPPYCQIEGAVLIFLPGFSDIQELYEMLTSHRKFNNTSKYYIYALHSLLASQDQTKVFAVPPLGVRKVVIATNIAETGITIPDVVYVIDSGKAKENRYMENSQMSSLEEVFISKANCKQRMGRAGRVRGGYCFRLYTREQYDEFKSYTKPELLRVPLEELCLNIMKCQYGKPQEFLSRALDPPQSTAISRAMSLLKEVGACYVDESSLTPLGHHLAALPVDIRIGKMLLLGSIFGCLEEIAVIAAAMTEKSPFVVPISKRSEADTARHSLAVACSDHITLYKAFTGWCKSRQESRSAENAYVSKHFLKKSTLLEIENVKKDLIKLIASIGFDVKSTLSSSKTSALQRRDELDSGTIALIKAVLTAGLYPQVGQVITTPSVDASEKSICMVETAQGLAQVHPSSVNRNLTASGSWMIYHEKVRVSHVYLRTTTIVSPYALLLFGGAIDVQHTQKVVSLDSWIRFKAVAKTGVIFKEVRLLLSSMLERKLQEPSLNISGCSLISLLKDLLTSEKWR